MNATPVTTAVTTAVAVATAIAPVTAAVAAASVTGFRIKNRRWIRLFTSTACVIALARPAWRNTNLGHAGRFNHRTRDFNNATAFAFVTDWCIVGVLRAD